jgi:outer membrane protein assembly factor BamB
VAGGRVFFGSDDGKVHAVEAGSGTKVWEFQTGKAGHGANTEIVMSYPAVGQNLVFVSSMDGKVYALEPGTGRMVWKFDAGDLVSPPAIWKDLIIVGSDGFYGLEARTGEQVWKFEVDSTTIVAPAIWRDLVFAVGSGLPLAQPPDNDFLAQIWLSLGVGGCRLYALNARTGKRVWESLHTTEGSMYAPSVWEEGKVEWPMYGGNPQHTGTGVQARDK